MYGFLKARLSARSQAPLNSLRRKTLRNHKWRLALYRTLAANFRAKVSFAQTLTIRAARVQRASPDSAYARILAHWAARASKAGVELHEVLAGWIPSLEQTILSGSEDEKGLERVIWFLQKQLASGKTAKAALVYPCLMLGTLFVALYVIGTQILPSIYKYNPGGEDHSVTLLITQYAWLVFIPFILAVTLIVSTFDTWTGDLRTWFDLHLWPWTMRRRRQGQAFLFAYSTLIKGKTEVQALNHLTGNARPWHRQRISAIAYHITEGLSFAQAAREAGHGFPDPELIDTLDGVQANQDDMASMLQTFAEEASNTEDERQNFTLMITGQVVMLITILSIALLAMTLINSFDFSGISDALKVH